MALDLSNRMAWKVLLTVIWLGSFFTLLSACQQKVVTTSSPSSDPALVEENWIIIDMTHTDHDQGSVLLTKVVSSTSGAMMNGSSKTDDAFVSAMHVTITPQTTIADEKGTPLTLSDLTAGMLIDITLDGPLAESYPMQGTAQKMIVHPWHEHVHRPEGWVSPEEAIEKALQLIRNDARIWGVSDIQITADAQATSGSNGEFVPNVWMITFLKGPDIDMDSAAQPSSASDGQQKTARAVTVDGQTGAVKHTIVAWHDAFRVYAPAPNSTIEPSFNIHGEARIFEGAFNYSLEDGHNILAEGTIQASQGAPGWGTFDVTISFDPSSTESYLTQTLILYEVSPKDGSPVHQLVIPLHLSRQKTP
ncbi:MAG: hypothetical protein BSOLF_1425 [Candidatus Carbobacillus altaicus]|uniref:Bacterial spore germination immunoglobulin-like domain-containing protein n=1 Tax=Candidatus Carbonibacillus altaicus TaxID=2163959 RepID=A0A2R6XZG1_9BACL|nr:MAG: hypothetical protein BSOLF_1425 [Candidatus Carbobacillus altaicus]